MMTRHGHTGLAWTVVYAAACFLIPFRTSEAFTVHTAARESYKRTTHAQRGVLPSAPVAATTATRSLTTALGAMDDAGAHEAVAVQAAGMGASVPERVHECTRIIQTMSEVERARQALEESTGESPTVSTSCEVHPRVLDSA